MTAAAEVAALRGIARRLGSSDRPIEPRQARAWSSAIQSCAGNLARAVENLRAELDGRAPDAAPLGPTGYEGVTASEAAARFASICARLTLEGASASRLMVERGRFVAAIATIAPVSAPQASGVAAQRADADGAGQARRDARATSNQAAYEVLPRTGAQRRRVLDAVVQVARNPQIVGLTDVQLAHATGLPANSVRPRRVELVAGGWLEPAQTTREHHGREHTVWVLTQKAVAAGELWSPPVREAVRA